MVQINAKLYSFAHKEKKTNLYLWKSFVFICSGSSQVKDEGLKLLYMPHGVYQVSPQ